MTRVCVLGTGGAGLVEPALVVRTELSSISGGREELSSGAAGADVRVVGVRLADRVGGGRP